MELAYIDPGTGSLLISVFFGSVATLLYSLRGFYYELTSRISGKSNNKRLNYSDKLVLFSEGKNYWRVFKPVIENLIHLEQEHVFLTADKDDPGLKIKNQYYLPVYIGPLPQAIMVLNLMKAKMCITTTPQLGVIALKLSPGVKHYCYLSHAPMDVHANKKFSFDYYDSVLCGSDYHVKNLRQLENDRKSKHKLLLKTGCTYFDGYDNSDQKRGNYVLLAPTWGERSFLNYDIELLISCLLDGRYKVLLRPHPQSWISDKEILHRIANRFEWNDNFKIDSSTDNSEAIAHSQTLICDVTSGIIFDAAFVYRKPIIAIDFEWDDGGHESSDLEEKASTYFLLEDVGKVITPADYQQINSIIESTNEKPITNQIIDRHIYNYRKAGPVAAEQIISIFKGIN